jgi:DNA-binding NarL/FixJ family response regulator
MNPLISVFIVDDHPLVREWLGNLLRLQADLTVAGDAGDAAAALQAMQAAPPDVAVVDLTLQRGSGLQLIKDLGDHLPETRVVVLSMHEGILDVERALRAGARGYVTKRESTHQIVSAIRQVNAGKIYADPSLLAELAGRMVGRPNAKEGTPVDILSDRELDVFRRLGDGHPTRKIAEDLRVSPKTVQTYCTRIKEKLALANVSELMRAAVRWSDSQRGDVIEGDN